MRIHVAVPGINRVRSLDIDVEQPPVREILYVGLQRFGELFNLDGIIHRLPERNRSTAEAIVLRAHPREARKLAPEANGARPHAVAMLHLRTKLPIYVLAFRDGAHHLHLVDGSPPPDQLLDDSIIPLIRQAEFTTYAMDPGALLPPSSTFHYVGPNGQHYSSFLRVGSALQTNDQLDAASFWLLPHAHGNTLLVVESSTIAVLGLHLAQYVREEDLTEHGRIESVQSIPGYDEQALSEFINRSRGTRPHSTPLRALVILSVASTGRLAFRAKVATRDIDIDDVSAVALYTTPGLDEESRGPLDDIFCELETDLGRSSADCCRLCNPKSMDFSPALQISPTTFTVGVAQSVVSTRLNVDPVARAQIVVDRYAGSGAFTTHKSDTSDNRHHAIHVDVGKLLATSSFQERMDAATDKLRGQVDVVLAPAHAVAEKMAARVGARLGLTVVVADASDLPRLQGDDATNVRLPRILFVDDVIISGERLRTLRSALVNAGIEQESCHALVGVLRCQDEAERQGIANIVHQRGRAEDTLHAVEELYLPNWGESECPWCAEAELLANHGRDPGDRVSKAISDRYSLLSAKEGLSNEVFWGWQDKQFPLGPGSIFGTKDLSQPEVCTVVASAIQVLRSNRQLDAEFTPPVSKVLQPEFWVSGRYYADVIQASIMRMSRPHDLKAPVPSKNYLNTVASQLKQPHATNLRIEMLLAMAQNKMPIVPTAEDVLTSPDVDDGVASLFVRLLRLNSSDT